MKLVIKEVKMSRRPRSSFNSSRITKEDIFDVKLGFIPFKGEREFLNYDSLFEVVSFDENSVVLNIKLDIRVIKKTVRMGEESVFTPMLRKDGLSFYRYEFELRGE